MTTPLVDIDPDIGILVSGHAIRRWRERHPEEHRHTSARRGMTWEVLEALREGRVSKNKPRWTAFLKRDAHSEGQRYCWPRGRSVAYVLSPARTAWFPDPVRAEEFKQRWLVVTVIPHNDRDMGHSSDAQALASAHDRLIRRQSNSRNKPRQTDRRRRHGA